MNLNVNTVAKFLLTNVTCKPNTFFMSHEQMCLELTMTGKLITAKARTGGLGELSPQVVNLVPPNTTDLAPPNFRDTLMFL